MRAAQMTIVESDVRLAERLARSAGEVLLGIRRTSELTGRALGDEGDRVANALIMRELRSARPDDAILSEETADTPARLSAKRVWVIDPLDGTREYSEGREDWAVHVALAIAGTAAVGAVALPCRDKVFTSTNVTLPPAQGGAPRMLVSRSRPAAEAVFVAEQLGATLIPMGSAGAKAMAVVRGDADIYLHTGGQYQWDNCAPVAVAMAAGLYCARVDGSPLTYNRPETAIPDLIICRPEFVTPVQDALALLA